MGKYYQEQEKMNRLYNNEIDKYGLLKISKTKQLKDFDPPRIIDLENDKTIYIINDQPLIKVFLKLINEGYIREISFRCIGDNVIDGIEYKTRLLEELQYGKPFSLETSNLPKTTVLYKEKNLFDKLFVARKGNEITFEELCDDLDIENGYIKTQVLHIRTINANGNELINHMDHEYIFYTEEEYENKLKDIETHGGIKIKTFKIDNSKIPFNYECESCCINFNEKNVTEEIRIPIIYYVLNELFKHEDLLKEYFKNLM